MDYEKAYKEAFERAKQVHASSVDENKKSAEYIFPQLKESEDEKMRKQLLNWFKDCHWDSIDDGRLKRDDIIAWFEKQDEKVDVIENFDTEFEKQVSHLLASIINKDWEYTEGFIKWASSSLLGYAKYELGKQDEKKQEWGEDERVRKELIDAVQGLWDNDALPMPLSVKRKNEWLAWLKKQGGQKPAWSEEDERNLKGVIDEIEANKNAAPDYDLATYDRFLSWLKSHRPQNTGKPQGKSALEASNEPVDKIEPRFKVGDWVVANYSCKVSQVVAVSEDGYGYTLNDGLCFGVSWCDIFHLWSIKNDARDGDVLVHNSCAFIFMGLKDGIVQAINEFFPKPTNFGDPDIDDDYHPATKEQCDLLFQKMEGAGYKWDSENKKVQTIMKIRKYE